MSTRANIIIKDQYSSLIFYKHSDGYPEGTMPILNKFMEWLKAGKIRGNVQQSAGWLIIIGAIEYGAIPAYTTEADGSSKYGDVDTIAMPEDWKCGSIEPTDEEHGDIEYLYTVDLETKTIEIKEVDREWNEDYTDCETSYKIVTV